MSTAVSIVDVSLRDGLQNESVLVATADKLRIADLLADAGARRIEVASFVHPKLVPAMADAEAVLSGLHRVEGVSYSALVLNDRGLDRALAATVDEINVVVCASDTFSRRNQNMSTEESTRIAAGIIERARTAGIFATLTVGTAFGCPFEGEVDPAAVLRIVSAAYAAGAQEICLADTIGVGVPPQVSLLAEGTRDITGAGAGLRFHFHNTRNTGYANAWAALAAGADTLDAGIGGIGGCPFAPRATGNIATEDLVYLLERGGHPTGLDLDALIATSAEMGALLGKELPALLPRAGGFPAAVG
ncbi:hydroxymethylglutaryl-CoA lyase [Nocardia sp. alder85J]|uniref:hydroxymethylglutaryl-CoA lyase n=1 Tax=Nocardia sp. alder85J TaxID=2862949 RepID=UPI001CD20B9D|nr:hydroxymethylglutaryl-CoA lyase [Nocardia sp. alder85J]MCX4091834.1 hydroxymethylglutaryl-CoA lyase [Nocardia sp. alder85J]